MSGWHHLTYGNHCINRRTGLTQSTLKILPAPRHVTLITASTKLSVVNIIFSVARQAIAAQGRCILALGRVFLVATFAGDFYVRSGQGIFGTLVVVEIPQSPGTCVVAALATHTHFLFVLVFFLMTGETITGGIFETCRQMACVATSRHMSSGERELRRRMVELLNPPRAVTVTRLASGARLPFVLVVFFVAAVAFHWRFTQAD